MGISTYGRAGAAVALCLSSTSAAAAQNVSAGKVAAVNSALTNSDHILFALIGGVTLLLVVLGILGLLFKWRGMADTGQAMGLPEGSVRALIALMLMLTFAILAIYLYDNSGRQGSGSLVNLSAADTKEFIQTHPGLPNLETVISKDSSGAPITTPEPRYDLSYGGATASDDFAKQLMTVLETLLTAVASFYFGAKTATSAASAATSAPAKPPADITSATPATAKKDDGNVPLKMAGHNLNGIVSARLERSGVPAVPLTGVTSNGNEVSGQVAIPKEMVVGLWDVVVSDGAGQTVRLKDGFTLS